MEVSDRERWDAKYRRIADERLGPPDAQVVRWLDGLAPPADGARALDLAGGRGRHALELARRGWRTTVWDVSPEGLARARAAADAAAVDVATVAVDLIADGPPAAEPFDVVVVVDFLHRPLLAGIGRLLAPGGHLLYATFTTERPGTRPPLRHCLEPGELARGVPGLVTIEAREEGGRAALLARRA